jgi:uncharacterized protein (TIGR02996 family)
MSMADVFMADILAHPDDDAPRLIFADWLEENSNAAGRDRAQFIRLQVELARYPESERFAFLVGRERGLLVQYRQAWLAELPGWARQHCHFERGFVVAVYCKSIDFVERGEQLFSAAPVRRVTLVQAQGVFTRLVACPLLAHLASLDLRAASLGDDEVQALAACPHLGSLTALDLSYNAIFSRGAEALAASKRWPRLTSLRLRGCNEIGSRAVESLRRRFGNGLQI